MSDKAPGGCASGSVDVRVELPLHYLVNSASEAPPESLRILQEPLQGQLNLRGDSADPQFRDVAERLLGTGLPTLPGTFVTCRDKRLYWLGPDEWLLIAGYEELEGLERVLRESLKVPFSVTDVSGGQALLNLSGPGLTTLLARSSAYDFHHTNFGPGRCVQTAFARTTALVSHNQDGSFGLVVRRSFADYIAQWLLDAGREFGCTLISRNFQTTETGNTCD